MLVEPCKEIQEYLPFVIPDETKKTGTVNDQSRSGSKYVLKGDNIDDFERDLTGNQIWTATNLFANANHYLMKFLALPSSPLQEIKENVIPVVSLFTNQRNWQMGIYLSKHMSVIRKYVDGRD